MKTIMSIFFLFLLFSLPITGQVDRSKAPRPGPAPEIKIGEFKSFVLLNGLKVFVVENHRLPIVSYSVNFVNTPVLEKESAGYSQMAGELLGTATKTRTKDQINEEIDFIGGTFNASSGGIFASSLKKHSSKLLDVVSDILLNPIFNSSELEKVRTQMLSSIAAGKDDPNSIANDVMSVLNFGKNHPYGEILTETSVRNITLDQCIDYFNTFFRPNVAYLSIVGDITLEEARPLVTKYFGNWQKKAVPDFTYEEPKPPASRKIAIVNRDESVQSVINIGYALDLNLSNPDYIKARVANMILGGGTTRLFNNLREKHGYTYGSYSSFTSMPLVGSFEVNTSVRNAVTDSSIYEILYEMENMHKAPVPADELSMAKNSMTGSFALSLEKPQTIASFAINTERYKLPKDFYKNYLKNLAAVTSADVQNVSSKYILPENCNILVVGKASDFAGKLTRFSKNITYYTPEGDPYDPSTGVPVLPDTFTAVNVLKKYMDAVGGLDKVSKIKDIKQSGTISVQGMNISITMIQRFPDKSFSEVKMGNSLLNKTVMFGNKATTMGMQGDQEVTGLEFDMLKLQALIFPESMLEQYGYNPSIKGVEKINSRNNYKIEVATPSGGVFTDYFDMETGLRTKTVVMLDSPTGPVRHETQFLEYFERDGVKYPKKIKQITGQQALDITMETLEVNTNPGDEVFR